MGTEQLTLLPKPKFDVRFMYNYMGKMCSDTIHALTELVANSHDAGAQNVHITWPVSSEMANPKFMIEDDGFGLSAQEFTSIWGTLNYNRFASNSNATVEILNEDNEVIDKRSIFGKNGKGRFSGFCLGSTYTVESLKRGEEPFSYMVALNQGDRYGSTEPFIFESVNVQESSLKSIYGLKITASITNQWNLRYSVDDIKSELGARFTNRPSFNIFVNGQKVGFNNISSNSLFESVVEFKGKNIVIKYIDTSHTDVSANKRGIAWWVTGRLVGNIDWEFLKTQTGFDLRTTTAKRVNIVVIADHLQELGLINEDWSGFNEYSEFWNEFEDLMIKEISLLIDKVFSIQSQEKVDHILHGVDTQTRDLGYLSRHKITKFVEDTVKKLPRLDENILSDITTILINLEQSSNKFDLIRKLATIPSSDLDQLHAILTNWGVNMAKAILDEVEGRLRTIVEFESRIKVKGIKEVQELQPLFNNALWMFGASFESIEFTSNQNITSVMRELASKKVKASRNRPDYVIIPNAFSRPRYEDDNENYEQIGLEQVIIVDLKTTGINLGSTEKDQIWKYVKELEQKGLISQTTRVHGFILGDQIEKGEGHARKEWDGQVTITPILYSTLLDRAKKRMFNLSETVKNSPILMQNLEAEEKRLASA
ncbi:ATP-binding protein [Acinetobacter calcoaceticus]|uniref:ATP-binding protein n=1 Tax=Acinetobacter calcoaceticus TaxID=471 RepID=UPI002273152B|nr:ATP-binding protein [Acinetobacter calcoaceticus]GLG83676.1 hypothetical protein ACSO1_21990 [Acinetobacter calcoaceticus]